MTHHAPAAEPVAQTVVDVPPKYVDEKPPVRLRFIFPAFFGAYTHPSELWRCRGARAARRRVRPGGDHRCGSRVASGWRCVLLFRSSWVLEISIGRPLIRHPHSGWPPRGLGALVRGQHVHRVVLWLLWLPHRAHLFDDARRDRRRVGRLLDRRDPDGLLPLPGRLDGRQCRCEEGKGWSWGEGWVE